MNIMIKLIIYTPQDYVEAVTGHRYTFDKNICAEIGKRLEDNGFSSLWDYSLSETGHVVQNKLSVVLVECRFELGRVVITVGANTRLVCPSVSEILLGRYANGDWGNLCDGDKQLNEIALKHGDRMLALI